MCGIAGILHTDGRLVDRSMLQRMTDAIAHRGPDGEGHWYKHNVGLGHRRLAIRDLGPNGHQPMGDDNGEIWVSYNGEIYNDRALRNEIERKWGYRFRSTCDTELLPIGWRIWGKDLFDRIEGMYAIAIWDARTKELILARDGIGIKPLYFAQTPQAVYFGSEIKALMATGALRANIEPAAFHTYLASGHTTPDLSLVAGITQVPPGSVITIDRHGNALTSSFWAPKRRPHIRNADEALEGLKSVLGTVCEEMLAADVPVGLLQSSGVDSALLAFTVSGDVPSFTATFAERSHDETEGARRLAAASGHCWHAVPVDNANDLAEIFRRVALAVDGQLADSSCLAHYLLSQAVRRKVTVALAGDGADEFFAGYPTYKASRMANLIGSLVPRQLGLCLANTLAAHYGADESRLPWHDVLGRFVRGLAAPGGTHHVEWRRLADSDTLRYIAGPALNEVLNQDPLQRYREPLLSSDGDLLDRCLLADQTVYLPSDMLMKVDRMSMANSLEIRVPFLDRRVMDFAGQIDGRLLARRTGNGKLLLREYIRQLGAGDSFVKEAKRGFNVPLSRLLRHDLRSVGDQLFNETPEVFAPLLNMDALRRLWQTHQDSKRNHAYLLWSLMIYGTWRMTLN
jgi:asparagine synthase (glutamine-hydrolysing)